MTKSNTNIFSVIYKIVLCVSIVVAGVSLIWGCLYIYYSGNGYSRDIVIDVFAKIRIPIYTCLVLVISSFFVDIYSKNSSKKFYRPKKFNQKKEPVLNPKKLLTIKIIIVVLGISLFVFGAINGGYKDVLTKAVNICTECIGLG